MVDFAPAPAKGPPARRADRLGPRSFQELFDRVMRPYRRVDESPLLPSRRELQIIVGSDEASGQRWELSTDVCREITDRYRSCTREELERLQVEAMDSLDAILKEEYPAVWTAGQGHSLW